ncbi:MAG: hypothetical protein ABEJ70_03100 [Halobacteriaceae archaeon]
MNRSRAVAAVALTVALFALALVGALAALGVSSLPTVVRSGFAPIAAVLALVVFRVTRDGTGPPAKRAWLAPATHAKLVVAVGALALAVTARTGSRVGPLLVAMPVGYLLVADQLAGEPPAAPTLVSLSTLFAVPSLAKYLTTGFYFGGTDIFAHVDAISRLVRAQYTTAIPHGYDLFPVYHLYVGTVSLLGDLSPYDAILLTGVAVYTLLVPTTYLVAARVFGDRRTALAAATGFTVLEYATYQSVYFFPQALAVALLVVGFYLVTSMPSARTAARLHRYAAYAVVLVGALVLLHHLTYLFLLGVLAAVLVVAVVQRPLAATAGWHRLARAAPRVRYRWLFPVVLGAVAFWTYLVYSGTSILVGIALFGYSLAFNFFTTAGPSSFAYGVTPVADTLSRAVAWFLTPSGVYYTLFAAVLLTGGYHLLARAERYGRRLPLLAVSVALTGFLLPLPVDLPQFDRFRFVVVVFAALPLGLGLARSLDTAPGAGRAAVAVLVLVAALGGTAPLTSVAADDVGSLHPGGRSAQVAMSDAEYRDVVGTARFLRANARSPAATDFVTRRALRSTGREVPVSTDLLATPTGLSAPPGPLVVDRGWSRHVVPVVVDEDVAGADLRWFTTSRGRIESAVALHDKVYDAGQVSVLYSDAPYEDVLGGPNATAS